VEDFGLKLLRSPEDEDFHDLVAERYERAATILTSSLDFPEWGEAFPGNKMIGAATLDRLRHGAYKVILDGLVSPSTGCCRDASFGPGQSICQPCLSGQAQGIRHGALDEPHGELLGHSVYDGIERLPNLTRAGIGESAFALTCRFSQSAPRALPGPMLVT
jgi:hypothetical protein